MKVKNILEQTVIGDARCRGLFEHLYAGEEVKYYCLSDTHVSFIFKGESAWYAFIDGRRTSLRDCVNFIRAQARNEKLKYKMKLEIDEELRKALLLEGL